MPEIHTNSNVLTALLFGNIVPLDNGPCGGYGSSGERADQMVLLGAVSKILGNLLFAADVRCANANLRSVRDDIGAVADLSVFALQLLQSK